MTALKFMIAAYVVTWAIHGGYLVTLVSRYSKLRREMKDVGKPPEG
jgi:CcmD family protein